MQHKLTPHLQKFKDDETFSGVFGVILFTNEHANVRSVLEDQIKWEQLDEVSGDKFVIFSSRMEKGRYKVSGGGRGGQGLMKQTWQEPNENKELLEIFDISSTEKLPLICFFAEVCGNVHQCQVKIDATDENTVLKSLTDAIKDVKNALEFVKSEDVHDGLCAFRVADIAVTNHNEWLVVKRVFKYIPGLGRLVA
ncbi:hypothetical protein A1OS_06175 [Enterovibrio norvegicus]|uniref:hypothetical protein n=1 Tax=Enterovibrio norvegicus TaxID=188144 RepID=UPI0002E95A00|nr:hypothetical protein [Enterovibrio norvegicus]OEE51301.1 hypothetical protein A1OS_06175 [Enterovibrio norvegicus]